MSRAASRLPVNFDTGSITAVAVLLAAVHFLTPPSIQVALAFDHGQFVLHTLLTAAYVHGSDSHLYNNLVGYAIAALYTYALCLSVDERRWFRRTFPVQLLVVPILVNLVSYAIFQLQFPDADPVSRGFSGVVSGFVGFLLVASYVFVRERHNREVGYAIGLGMLLVVLQLIDLRYAGRMRPSVTGLIALGGMLVIVPYLRDGIGVPTGTARITAMKTSGAIGVVGFIFIYLMLHLFPDPGTIVTDGTITNVFGHAAGFVWGALISIVTWSYRGA